MALELGFMAGGGWSGLKQSIATSPMEPSVQDKSGRQTSVADDKDGQRALCRILLVEDDGPVRDRLARIIGEWPGGQLVASCATLAEATAAIRGNAIDLLITDLNLPDGHGVQAIRMLRSQQPDSEAMVISVLADDRNVIEAIEAGASGYLLKDSDPINIIDAIADLLAGRSPISSAIARTIVRRLGGRAAAAEPKSEGDTPQILTPREMDILWGIAKGFTYGELADRLQISKQTVPVHIKNIYRKLQASNRSEAVYEASRRGLIRL
jgi:DNA-binding NarL/FixJ family response regulator